MKYWNDEDQRIRKVSANKRNLICDVIKESLNWILHHPDANLGQTGIQHETVIGTYYSCMVSAQSFSLSMSYLTCEYW